MPYWWNPSKVNEVWDPNNNLHVQPGGRVSRPPALHLVQSGQLLKVEDEAAEVAVLSSPSVPLRVAGLILKDVTAKKSQPDAEEEVATPTFRRKSRKK